jgi:mannose-6-phosphate isomerase-like protein (cupin superfamily)
MLSVSAARKVNLKQLENSATASGLGVDARFARSHLGSEHLGVSYFRYPPNYRPTTGHRHREQEEAYIVRSGSGRMRVDDEVLELGRWDVIRVSPDGVRAFAAGPDGLELIAVASDRPEGGESVTVEDWWASES